MLWRALVSSRPISCLLTKLTVAIASTTLQTEITHTSRELTHSTAEWQQLAETPLPPTFKEAMFMAMFSNCRYYVYNIAGRCCQFNSLVASIETVSLVSSRTGGPALDCWDSEHITGQVVGRFSFSLISSREEQKMHCKMGEDGASWTTC